MFLSRPGSAIYRTRLYRRVIGMEYPFLMRCLLEYICGMASVKECQEPSSFEDSIDRGAVAMTGACI